MRAPLRFAANILATLSLCLLAFGADIAAAGGLTNDMLAVTNGGWVLKDVGAVISILQPKSGYDSSIRDANSNLVIYV